VARISRPPPEQLLELLGQAVGVGLGHDGAGRCGPSLQWLLARQNHGWLLSRLAGSTRRPHRSVDRHGLAWVVGVRPAGRASVI
jgi:hypothetical protein